MHFFESMLPLMNLQKPQSQLICALFNKKLSSKIVCKFGLYGAQNQLPLRSLLFPQGFLNYILPRKRNLFNWDLNAYLNM